MYMSVAGQPIDKFQGVAKEFADNFSKEYLNGKTIDPYAIYGAQAAQVMLDAIGASDGSRSRRDREDVRHQGRRTACSGRSRSTRTAIRRRRAVPSSRSTIYKATDKLRDGAGRSRRSSRRSTQRSASRHESGSDAVDPDIAGHVAGGIALPPHICLESPDDERRTRQASRREHHRPDRTRRSSALVVFWLVVNFVKAPAEFIDIGLIGLTNGTIYGLVALGYTLVYGILQLINFAHGDVFALSGLVASTVIVSVLGLDEGSSVLVIIGGLAFTLVVIMGGFALFNASIERVAYKPLRNAPRLAPLITAVGVSFIVQNIGLALLRRQLPDGAELHPAHGRDPHRRRSRYSWSKASVLIIVIPLLVVLSWFVRSTKQGKAMRAVAQDTEASAMMGIDVNRTISVTFLLAGALAGAAGHRLPAAVQHALRHRVRARPDRVHRRRARRDRQPHRRRARRAHDRVHPGVQRGPRLARAGERLDALDGVRDPDPDPRLPSRRASSANRRRRARDRPRDTCALGRRQPQHGRRRGAPRPRADLPADRRLAQLAAR